jgi:hypothetical protein
MFVRFFSFLLSAVAQSEVSQLVVRGDEARPFGLSDVDLTNSTFSRK